MIKHGGFAQKYLIFVKKLSPLKFIFAVEMFGGLMEMSDIDFEVTHEIRDLDTSDSQFIEEESVEITLPIPTNETVTMQANELWTAALKEVMTQNMQEAVFAEGMSKRTLAQSADMEGQITDTIYESTEHHLHLPISRVASDIKNHLQNGGVAVDNDDGGAVTFQKNDYTLDVSPSEGEQQDAESVTETAGDFAEHLKEDETAEIEVE